jgi:hypothetical protein
VSSDEENLLPIQDLLPFKKEKKTKPESQKSLFNFFKKVTDPKLATL